MTEVFIDFETRSELGLSSKDRRHSTVYEYARHPSTEILCLSYAIDDEPVRTLRMDNEYTEYPFDLKAAIMSGAQVVAHNAYFERNIWESIVRLRYMRNVHGSKRSWSEIQPDQWRCSMAVAGYSGLPLGLDDACKVLGLKGKHDQAVLHKMMKPNPAWYADPTKPKWLGDEKDWEVLLKYNAQDVEIERALWKRLRKFPDSELAVWRLDYLINQRGVPIDRGLASACAKLTVDLQSECKRDLQEISCGVISTPNQVKEIRNFCSVLGVDLPNLQEQTVSETLETLSDESHPAYQVLEIRSICAGAAAGKFQKILDLASPDDRVRGAYTYYGGRTGRFASRGLQVHNLAKQKMEWGQAEDLIPLIMQGDVESLEVFYKLRHVLSSVVRPCICAPEEQVFVVQDYAAIEARVVAWIAKDDALLGLFKSGEDPYKSMASWVYQIPVSEVTGKQRGFGKAAILGLGFGMGGNKFEATAKSWGIVVPRELIDRAVDTYRGRFSKVVGFWYALQQAFADALTYPYRKFEAGRIQVAFFKTENVLTVYLPSGRPLFYHDPRISTRFKKNGEEWENSFSYLGRTGEQGVGSIGRVWGWGGKWTENVVQATARDCLTVSMIRVEKELDYAELTMHTHDEIGMLVSEGKANQCYDEMGEIMRDLPAWAKGLPVDCKGWIGRRYRKD